MDEATSDQQVDTPQVVYRHYRVDRETGQVKRYQRGLPVDERWDPSECGGYTFCALLVEGKVAGVGIHHHEENFCYRIGREAAHGRALRDAGLLQGIRAERKARRLAAKQQQDSEG